jgi:hypothetical protein
MDRPLRHPISKFGAQGWDLPVKTNQELCVSEFTVPEVKSESSTAHKPKLLKFIPLLEFAAVTFRTGFAEDYDACSPAQIRIGAQWERDWHTTEFGFKARPLGCGRQTEIEGPPVDHRIGLPNNVIHLLLKNFSFK